MIELSTFNTADSEAAAQLIDAACASTRWLAEVVDGRPYADLDELCRASDRAVARLNWPDLLQALSVHPRIGDRAEGTDREATFSRQEQSGAVAAPDEAEQLTAGNLAYEQRFGHVFLIRAAGRNAADVLAELQRRLSNEPADEQVELRRELGEIVRLRLQQTFDGPS